MNTKYGRLSNGRIEYAPSSLETEDGVKMNPSEASYLAAGWKKVVDVKPTVEAGHRIEVSGWQESEDTLTCVYKVVAGEHFPTLEAVLLAESLEPLDFVNACHRRHSS